MVETDKALCDRSALRAAKAVLKANAGPLIACLLLFTSQPALADDDLTTTWVQPGENVDVYFQVNLEGQVFVAADVNGAPACLDYWWITWPLGRVEELGRHCGGATFDIPSLWQFTVASQLRAGGADQPTRIQGTSEEGVASNFLHITF